MFDVTLPDDPKSKDFQKAKAMLIGKAATLSMKAKAQATYAFGQRIGHTSFEVTRAFKQALRSLNDYALIATGEAIATEAQMAE